MSSGCGYVVSQVWDGRPGTMTLSVGTHSCCRAWDSLETYTEKYHRTHKTGSLHTYAMRFLDRPWPIRFELLTPWHTA